MSAETESNFESLWEGTRGIEALSEKSKKYFTFHRRRLEFLSGLISRELADGSFTEDPVKVLDVAPHFTTNLIRRIGGEKIELNTLGWLSPSLVPLNVVSNHFEFDLNNIHFPDRWLDPTLHQIVVAGEIVEHLFASPVRIFEFLSSFVQVGGILIVQTPNAVSIRKRLKVLLGQNPYEFINDRRDGHVREFTQEELVGFCQKSGLIVEYVGCNDYWPERGMLRLLEKFAPSLRRGLTVVARKDA